MKKIISVVLLSLIIMTIPAPILNAEDITYNVSANKTTIVEMEDLGPRVGKAEYCSGGAFLGPETDTGTTPLQGKDISFKINVLESGYYDIDFAMSKCTYAEWWSRSMLYLDDEMFYDNWYSTGTIIRTYEQMPSANFPIRVHRKENYFLTKGEHTVVLKTTNFASAKEANVKGVFDYVAFKPKTATVEMKEPYWDETVTELNAKITYRNDEDAKNIEFLGAIYTEDNELLHLIRVPKTASANESVYAPFKLATGEEVAKIKFFVWEQGTYKPLEVGKTVVRSDVECVYIDPASQSATEDGSAENPYKKLDDAVDKLASLMNTSDKDEIVLLLSPGEHRLTKTITNSHTSKYKKVTITSQDPSQKASISGAKHLSGADFSLYDEAKGIYRISVPEGLETRQLYVNGTKATRARSGENEYVLENPDYKRGWTGGTPSNPTREALVDYCLKTTEESFLTYKHIDELEAVFTTNWANQRYMIDSVDTDTDGNVRLKFDGANKSAWERAMNVNSKPGQYALYVENALELLDEEGEWYLDTHENYLYYKPRASETLSSSDVVIPEVERLLYAEGTADAPVRNLTLQNINFEYSTWNKPTTDRFFFGSQDAQTNTTIPDSRMENTKFYMDGAVEFVNAHNINIDNCDFSYLGSIGLKMTGAVQNCSIIGNEFYENSGSAIRIGKANSELGADYDAALINPVAKNRVLNTTIANNYIHTISTDYRSAAAVSLTISQNTVVRNNEITDCSYMGIHVQSKGGDMQKMLIEKNYVHNVMNWQLSDGGAIYNIGASSTVNENNQNIIRYNYMKDVKNTWTQKSCAITAREGHVGVIYPDEGSNYWYILSNFVDERNYRAKWYHIWKDTVKNVTLEKNYATTWWTENQGEAISLIDNTDLSEISEENWPEEVGNIIANAGIEAYYKERFE